MNQYHKAFLSWNFQKGLEGFKIDYVKGKLIFIPDRHLYQE